MPEETEMQEQVVEEQPVVEEEVSQESAEVNVDELPDNIKDYIYELREEAKDRRKTHEPYKEAFKDYNDSEKEYLLDLVTTLSSDQEVGANAMKELAQHLLGEEPVMDQPDELEVQDKINIPESDLVSSDNIATLVQEELEKERLVQDVYEKSRALGFEPESPECEVLWDLALTPAINGDLEKAAELARAYLGDKAPANPNAQPVAEQQTLFPASATAAGTGTVADIEPQEVPNIKSDSMRDKVLARLNSQVGE
jgi:hypothetical protein